jgi:serine/threonine protein kinase
MVHKRKKIGGGGFGTVYSAELIPSMIAVAIKSFNKTKSTDAGVPLYCIREISILKALNHVNVVKLLHIFAEDSQIEIVMEHGGITLGAWIKKTTPNNRCKQLLSIESQIAAGLHHMHTLGIAHRDIKPSNILISPDGAIKLCDLGLSMHTSNRRNSVGVGSSWYRAPELFNTYSYNTSVDIWSFGCVLYETATGKPLFSGANDLTILSSILKIVPTTPSALHSVGLDMINIESCNTSQYFRIYPLYNDLDVAAIDSRQMLDALKLRIESMITLEPSTRIVLARQQRQYPAVTASVDLAKNIYEEIMTSIAASDNAVIKNEASKRQLAIMAACSTIADKFYGCKRHPNPNEPSDLQPDTMKKWELYILRAIGFDCYRFIGS